jgi:fructokinase
MMRIGIDLGGTKIEGIVLDVEGTIVARSRVPTPSGYEACLDALFKMVEGLELESGVSCSVGVGMPGAKSPDTGRVMNSNNTPLDNQSFDTDLSARLGREVRIANDANCFALSEAVDGAGRGAPVVMGAILGTGVGAGLVVHQRVISGVNAIAGEWGHNPLPWPKEDEFFGPNCYCGQRGCIEMYLGGPGLRQQHHKATGSFFRATDIAAQARAGREEAVRTMERFHDRLARSVATVVNVLDPDVIVFGGGVSKIREIYDELPVRLRQYVFSDRVRTRIAQSEHGAASGVRGAAWLWPEEEHAQGLPQGS